MLATSFDSSRIGKKNFVSILSLFRESSDPVDNFGLVEGHLKGDESCFRSIDERVGWFESLGTLRFSFFCVVFVGCLRSRIAFDLRQDA